MGRKTVIEFPRPKGKEPKTPEPTKRKIPKELKTHSTIIVTVTTLFGDSIFYKPAETYTIRTTKQYDVNGEIERFFKRLGKREEKSSYTLSKLGVNPSVRDIWKVMADGRIIYRRKLVATIEDDVLDMACTIEDLVQDLDYTFEDITRFMHFLPSLLGMCKAHKVDVTNIPSMPTLEEYKKWKDEYD